MPKNGNERDTRVIQYCTCLRFGDPQDRLKEERFIMMQHRYSDMWCSIRHFYRNVTRQHLLLGRPCLVKVQLNTSFKLEHATPTHNLSHLLLLFHFHMQVPVTLFLKTTCIVHYRRGAFIVNYDAFITLYDYTHNAF